MDALLNNIKELCLNNIQKSDGYFYGSDRVNAEWRGALTTDISSRHDLSLSKTRYRLKLLQSNGLLIESKCPGGITRWWPKGLTEELQMRLIEKSHQLLQSAEGGEDANNL